MEPFTDKKAKVTISKKRYNDFATVLDSMYEDKEMVQNILKALCDTLQFDPTMNTYDQVQCERIRARRERMKEEGISTYVSSGRKLYYEKHT